MENVKLRKIDSHWTAYRPEEHYGKAGFEAKKMNVRSFLSQAKPEKIFDLGSNTGVFSDFGAEHAKNVISFDSDPSAVDYHWSSLKKKNIKNVLPLVMNLSQPTPGMGWENAERFSFLDRGPANLVMALGLVHHLAIADGIPLELIAGFFSKLGSRLIVEFIPETDPKARELGSRKNQPFARYNRRIFEEAFSAKYKILESRVLENSRILYFMEISRDKNEG